MSHESLGSWGEQTAEDHLRSLGYAILARNWHSAEGELDVIAEQHETLVFVEVKARASDAFGPPEAAITKGKQKRLQRAAWRYLESVDRLEAPWRIDVIAIERADSGGVARLEHYVNAVEAASDLGHS